MCLKKRGLKTVMLTGDNQQVAEVIANEVGDLWALVVKNTLFLDISTFIANFAKKSV